MGVSTLVLWSIATVMSCIDASDSDKIPEGGTGPLLIFSISLVGTVTFYANSRCRRRTRARGWRGAGTPAMTPARATGSPTMGTCSCSRPPTGITTASGEQDCLLHDLGLFSMLGFVGVLSFTGAVRCYQSPISIRMVIDSYRYIFAK